jgi:hypothetical protein
MSARDVKLILGYLALFGGAVLAFGYQASLKHRLPGEVAVPDRAALLEPPVQLIPTGQPVRLGD